MLQKSKLGLQYIIKRAMIIIITLGVCIFFTLSCLNNIFIEGKGTAELYIEVLNFSMPMIKASTDSSEDLVESRAKLKNKILDKLGLNIFNPINILGKEIAYLSIMNTSNTMNPIPTPIKKGANPFILNENSIAKDEEDPKEEIPGEGNSNIPNQVVSVYDPKLKKSLNNSKPEIFIYHSHTSESYKPGERDSDDETKNVTAVGSALAEELEKNYGISVIHDKTIHNSTYTQSYTRSRETLDKYLKKYGDFKLIIDLHRDSVSNKNAVTAKFNNEQVAKVMFVMTRKNPSFAKNNAIATKMNSISESLFPGLSRGMFYYETGTKYFNQDKSSNAILIEVGADINTLNEAKATSKYIARVVAEYLNKK